MEIKGKRRTVAKCLPLYPSDEGRGLVRIDGLIRNNAGVAIGDVVVVKKVKAPPAERWSSRPSKLYLRSTSAIWPTLLRACR